MGEVTKMVNDKGATPADPVEDKKAQEDGEREKVKRHAEYIVDLKTGLEALENSTVPIAFAQAIVWLREACVKQTIRLNIESGEKLPNWDKWTHKLGIHKAIYGK